jgi:multidrug efflux system membrane fusion protein
MSDPQTPTAVERPTYTKPPATVPPQPPLPPEHQKRSVWPWIILLLLIGGGVYYYLNYWKKPAPGQAGQPEDGGKQGSGGKRGGGRGGAGGAIPVVGVKAVRGNIGVYDSAPGNVTPIYSVTLKSRVDGQLMSVKFKEGDMVTQGDLLAEIDPRPYQAQLTQYEGQLLRDQALLENAKVDMTRYETLLKQNAIPEQQLATQKSQVTQDEGVVKMDQGLIDSVKVNLAYTKITSPITGRVGLRLVDPGNIVHASDSNGLIVITQMQPISVIFTIAEDHLPDVLQRLHGGQRLTVDAYDRAMQQKISTGVLTTSDNVIDQTTGTLKLRATFDNNRSELFPNQLVNARLLVQQKTGVVLLPTAAIQRNTNSTYVWIVKPDTTVTIRPVTIGTVEGEQSEIVTGLQANETVVMTGVDKLQENSKVNVQIDGDKRGKGASAGPPGSSSVTPTAPGTQTEPAQSDPGAGKPKGKGKGKQ